MYLLFRFHHIIPSIYQNMGFGEKTVTRAFLHYEMEQRIEEQKELEKL